MKTNLLDLPEECLVLIFSLTSPFYVLRCSLVCKLFNSIANSDLVWKKLLPSDLHPLIQDSCICPTKHLVLLLCRSFILLENGTMSFSLDEWIGKKSYVMGARTLTFAQSSCWRWKLPLPKSRFLEVAELLGVEELHVTGRISTKLLSLNTTYRMHFSFILERVSCGFDIYPVRVFVSRIDTNGAYLTDRHDSSKTFYLKAPKEGAKGDMFNDAKGKDTYNTFDDIEHEDTFDHGSVTRRWLKIDMGKYFHKGDNDVAMLEMTIMGTELGLRKYGLVVHAIELQPVD
ncbi:putative F-box protein PP2-B12 [Bienertia sinuspersici]